MKRFYQAVTVGNPEPERFSILLDGKPIKTPGRAALLLPSRALAEAVAAEWQEQGEEVDPAAMVLTKCANTAIDQVSEHVRDVVEAVLAFANDLLCYRAGYSGDLVARQSEAWDPLLDWSAEHLGARLKTNVGVSYIEQDETVLAQLRQLIAAQNIFTLTAMYGVATILGSLVLTLAVLEGRLTAAEAFLRSRVDEAYQAEKWGHDAEADTRTRLLGEELTMLAGFMIAARSPTPR
jgi:chaperone required for assembly of F1-ATPase